MWCLEYLTGSEKNKKMANRVVTKLKKANSVDPDETARTSRLVWIYIVCKTFFWPLELKGLKGMNKRKKLKNIEVSNCFGRISKVSTK